MIAIAIVLLVRIHTGETTVEKNSVCVHENEMDAKTLHGRSKSLKQAMSNVPILYSKIRI